jgi:hypothetical protein
MRLTVGFRTAAAANPCTRPCGGWRRRHRRGDGISSRITSASGSSVVPLPGICRRASRSKDARGTVRELLSHSDSGPLHLPSQNTNGVIVPALQDRISRPTHFMDREWMSRSVHIAAGVDRGYGISANLLYGIVSRSGCL